jgi:peptidoglycan/LPS O-acetylase OafA/YrhL
MPPGAVRAQSQAAAQTAQELEKRIDEMSSASLQEAVVPGQRRPDILAPLTGIRFVAAFTIAAGHTYQPVAVLTIIGMPLFFTLSGFIIHYVYSGAFAAGWRPATAKFAEARFSRIYPLYIILLGVAVITTPMGSVFYHSDAFGTMLAYIFACWTWLPLPVDGRAAQDWYYSISWSVPTEIFFYLCYAILLHRLARIRSVRTCAITLGILCVGAYAWFYLLFETRDAWEALALQYIPSLPSRTTDFQNSFYRWFLYFSPYSRIFEFGAGCLTCQLYLLLRRDPGALRGLNFELLSWLPTGLIAVIVALCRIVGEHQPWLRDQSLPSFFLALHMNFLLAPFCCALILALALGRSTLSRILSTGAAVLLGEISYSTYLGHPLAQEFILNSALGHVRHLATLAELVAIYAFSWMFYQSLEVPSKVWLRRLFTRVSPFKSASATTRLKTEKAR